MLTFACCSVRRYRQTSRTCGTGTLSLDKLERLAVELETVAASQAEYVSFARHLTDPTMCPICQFPIIATGVNGVCGQLFVVPAQRASHPPSSLPQCAQPIRHVGGITTTTWRV